MPHQHNAIQQCAGCNRPIQPMQPYEWWGQYVVCLPCFRAYSQQQAQASETPQPDPLAAAVASGAVQQYRPTRHAPDYAWIRIGAGTLASFGVLAVLVGLWSIVQGIANPSGGTDEGPATIAGATRIVVGGGMVAYGILLFFAASIGMAIRDVARNSFRW